MIPQIKRLLYAADLSKNSSYTLITQPICQKRHDAKIVILRAVQSSPAYVNAYSGITVDTEQIKQVEIVEEISGTQGKGFFRTRLKKPVSIGIVLCSAAEDQEQRVREEEVSLTTQGDKNGKQGVKQSIG